MGKGARWLLREYDRVRAEFVAEVRARTGLAVVIPGLGGAAMKGKTLKGKTLMELSPATVNTPAVRSATAMAVHLRATGCVSRRPGRDAVLQKTSGPLEAAGSSEPRGADAMIAPTQRPRGRAAALTGVVRQ